MENVTALNSVTWSLKNNCLQYILMVKYIETSIYITKVHYNDAYFIDACSISRPTLGTHKNLHGIFHNTHEFLTKIIT